MTDKAESKRVPFGGLTVSFDKVKDTTIGEIMGEGNFPIAQMTKKTWDFVKKNELTSKPPAPAYKKLIEYWDDTEFEDMDFDDVSKIMKKMGAKEKAYKTLKAIFKKQEKDPDTFEEEIEGFVDELIDAAKVKVAKVAKEAKAEKSGKKTKSK